MKNQNTAKLLCVMFSFFILFTCASTVGVAAQVDESVSSEVQTPDLAAAAPDTAGVAADGETMPTDGGVLLEAPDAASADTAEDGSVQESAAQDDSGSGKIGKWLDKTFYNFDWKIFSFFGSIQSKFLNGFFKTVTNFGDELFTIPMLLAGIAMTLFKRTRKYGFALIFAIIIGTLLTNCIFKVICARVRPYITLAGTGDFAKWYSFVGAPSESDNSFPSGHTTAAMEMAVVLFMTFGKKGNRFRWIFPVIGLLVPISRIYLMVHYPTDVIAGIFIGTLAAVISYFIVKVIMSALAKNEKRNNFDLAVKLKKKA